MAGLNPTRGVSDVDSEVDHEQKLYIAGAKDDDSMDRKDFMNGVKALVGGFLLQLFLGSQYIAGNIAPYVLTYYTNKGQKGLTETSTFYILPVMIIIGVLFFPIGGRLARSFKPRTLIFTIAPIGLIGIFVSSFIEDYWTWLGVFGASFGFTNGCLYIMPI